MIPTMTSNPSRLRSSRRPWSRSTPSVPAKTVKDLVALIRANPGKYSYSSAGAGTQAHLAGEQFRVSLGLDLVHVPFNGGGPAIAAVVGGHIPIGLSSPAASI